MYFRSVVVAGALAVAGAAWSHGDTHKSRSAAKPAPLSTEAHAFGRAGNPAAAKRTIRIAMDDRMQFVAASPQAGRATDAGAGSAPHSMPGDIVVKRGDTVRFVVRNDGKLMHEMVIGRMQELKEHAELMRKFPGMEHDEPYMAHVAPGKTGEIVWQFTRAGEFHYACLIPGHMEAGMISRITVK
jgi:uncharacterized cupredoxin-like copper-binding protein